MVGISTLPVILTGQPLPLALLGCTICLLCNMLLY